MWELLRSIDQDALALVVVAVVTGVFGILQNRRTRQSFEERIGTPNGQGTVVQMQETQLQRLAELERIVVSGQSEQDKRLARLEQADVSHERALDAHERIFSEHDRRLGVLESTIPKEGT